MVKAKVTVKDRFDADGPAHAPQPTPPATPVPAPATQTEGPSTRNDLKTLPNP